MVRGISHLGGTILGTTNHGNPLRFVVTDPDGNNVKWIAVTTSSTIYAAWT